MVGISQLVTHDALDAATEGFQDALNDQTRAGRTGWGDYSRFMRLKARIRTKGALHEMVAPALLAIIVPIVTGLILGPTGVVGLLGGVSVTGFAMANI